MIEKLMAYNNVYILHFKHKLKKKTNNAFIIKFNFDINTFSEKKQY